MSISIRRNASEPMAPVYRMFRHDLPVHAPMPHVVYRHSMNRVCSNDPDMNGDFHSDIRRRSEDEIERSRSRLDVSLLNRLSRSLLGHIGSFLIRECSLFIKTLQARLIVVRIPHRFISVRTVKLALSEPSLEVLGEEDHVDSGQPLQVKSISWCDVQQRQH